MKSLKAQSRSKFSIPHMLLLAVLAASTFTVAAYGNGLPTGSENLQRIGRDKQVDVPLAISNSDTSEALSTDREPVLIAQGVEWCYTDFGPYLMAVWMPVGSYCHVNVPFDPYVLDGFVGY